METFNRLPTNPIGLIIIRTSIQKQSFRKSKTSADEIPIPDWSCSGVKLRRSGYTRSITGLYRVLRRQGQMAVKLPNPKYIPKPYEKMRFPGERVQIDVKFVPEACIVGDAAGEKFYQYTAIDEFSRWRYLEAFQEHSTYSSAQFLEHLIKAAPFKILCVQTDNGTEFTKRLLPWRQRPQPVRDASLTGWHPPQAHPPLYSTTQRQGRTFPPQG